MEYKIKCSEVGGHEEKTEVCEEDANKVINRNLQQNCTKKKDENKKEIHRAFAQYHPEISEVPKA